MRAWNKDKWEEVAIYQRLFIEGGYKPAYYTKAVVDRLEEVGLG